MTEFFIPLECVWAREYARPGPVGGSARGIFSMLFPPGPAEIDISNDLCPGAIPTSLVGYMSDGTGAPTGPDQWEATSGGTGFPNDGGSSLAPQWMVGPPGPGATSNGSTSPLVWQRRQGRVDGAASALIPPGTTHFTGAVDYIDPGLCIGGFADTQDGDNGLNNPAMLQGISEQLSAAGGGQCNVKLPSSQVDILITACGAAFVRCDGVAVVAPGDVGANPGQLPNDASQNTGAIWQQHPGTFIRETNAVRGLQPLNGNDPTVINLISIDSSGIAVPPLSIFECVRAPTHSRWCLFVDGEKLDVIVAHPAGSDLRRPRDIWNAVFAPAIQTREGISSPLPTFQKSVGFGPVNVFSQSGNVRHLKYLQAATYVEPFDSDPSPILIFIPQNGANGND